MLTFGPMRMNEELQNFITDGARRITPAHLDKLVRLLPNIRLAITQVTEFPDLPDQVEFLAEIVERFSRRVESIDSLYRDRGVRFRLILSAQGDGYHPGLDSGSGVCR
jgi:hypothetical protein